MNESENDKSNWDFKKDLINKFLDFVRENIENPKDWLTNVGIVDLVLFTVKDNPFNGVFKIKTGEIGLEIILERPGVIIGKRCETIEKIQRHLGVPVRVREYDGISSKSLLYIYERKYDTTKDSSGV